MILANDFVIKMTAEGGGIPEFHISMDPADLTPQAIFETAIIISLFTDRLANDDDIIPDGSRDRRGFWGDALSSVPGDKIGSRLWLLSREKQMTPVLRRAEEYAYEALEWMLEDGVASHITVVATNPTMGWLKLDIDIQKPATEAARYSYIWEGLNGV